MSLLTHDEIMELHAATIEAELVERRDLLLAGISPRLRATIPQAPTPSTQLLVDLEAMNAVGVLADATTPLQMWLRNASALSQPKPASAAFARYLDELPSRLRRPRPEREPEAQVPEMLPKGSPQTIVIGSAGVVQVFPGGGVVDEQGEPSEVSHTATTSLDVLEDFFKEKARFPAAVYSMLSAVLVTILFAVAWALFQPEAGSPPFLIFVVFLCLALLGVVVIALSAQRTMRRTPHQLERSNDDA